MVCEVSHGNGADLLVSKWARSEWSELSLSEGSEDEVAVNAVSSQWTWWARLASVSLQLEWGQRSQWVRRVMNKAVIVTSMKCKITYYSITFLFCLFQVIKPGGILFFRDYRLYDQAMLRFNPANKLSDNFYVHQDGTRAYYFSKGELDQLGILSCLCPK